MDLAAICKQVEYYFSDVSYPRDKHLRTKCEGDENGFVDIAHICTFKRMITLGATVDSVADAVANSDVVVLDDERQRIKRKHALPDKPVDWQARTIYVKGWAANKEEPDIDFVRNIFEPSGEVLRVQVRRYESKLDGKKHFRGSLFVEFITPEAAERAVAEDYSAKVQDENGKLVEKELYTEMAEEYFQRKAKERREFRNKKKEGMTNGKKVKTENKVKKEETVLAKQNGNGNHKEEDIKVEGLKMEAVKEEAVEAKKEQRELVRGLILKFSDIGDASVSYLEIKEALAEYGDVRFVEKEEENCEGFVRFKNPGDAKKAADGMTESKKEIRNHVPTWTLLEGEEEENWWKKNWEVMDEKAAKKRQRDGRQGGGGKRFRGRGRRGGFRGGRGRKFKSEH